MPAFNLMRVRSAVAVGAALALVACGDNPLAVNGTPGRTIKVATGQEFTLKLQTIGPGEYASPPTISSPALQYLGVSFATPAVPAGPTQLFLFRAAAHGQAVVTFVHTGSNPSVEDTVVVN
jgi:hypothetical protein